MSFHVRELPFAIPPMKSSKSPYTKPNVKQISFEFPFSKNMTIQFPLDDDIDTIWANFTGIKRKDSFRKLLHRISECKVPDIVFSAFSNDIISDNELTLAIMEELRQFSRILPPSQTIAFLSQSRLEPSELIEILPRPQSQLFVAVLHFVESVFSAVEDHSSRCAVLRKTAQCLVPQSLIDSFGLRPYLTLLLLLPVKSTTGESFWISLYQSGDVVLSMMNSNDKFLTADLDGIAYDAKSGSIVFGKKSDAGGISVSFVGSDAAQVWIEAMEHLDRDPISHFISCFKVLEAYFDNLPNHFYDQLLELVSAPDLEFFRAFGHVASLKGMQKRSILSSFVSLGAEAGTLAPFIRYIFGIEVDLVQDETTIFRETSCASSVSNVIMSFFGSSLAEEVSTDILKKPDNLVNAIHTVAALKSAIPPQLCFIHQEVFRATRRRFTKNLVPLHAIGGMFFLRYLLPVLSTKSAEGGRLGQRILNAFVFHNVETDPLDPEIFRVIATFYLSTLKVDRISFPFQKADVKSIINFIGNYHQEISSVLTRQGDSEEHPLMWSILETLENVAIGLDEDFDVSLAKRSIV